MAKQLADGLQFGVSVRLATDEPSGLLEQHGEGFRLGLDGSACYLAHLIPCLERSPEVRYAD